MRVCNCALPYISSRGYKVCENCSNNWEQNNTLEGTDITFIKYPDENVFDFSPIYICKKCGNRRQDLINVLYNEEQNLLDIECEKCGYTWKEDTYDKSNDHKEKEKKLEELLKEYDK